MGPVAKLTLRPKTGGGPQLVLPYNPEELRVSGSANFSPIDSEDGVPGQQYTGRTARTTSVTARLDARALTRSVADTVQQVFGWLSPTAESLGQDRPMPPVLVLSWGRTLFDAVLTSADATYTVFAADGTPTRAVLEMGLTEIELPVPRQNPTSGSLVGSRSHRVVAGDTLHSIATAEYGHPRHWRDLALANGLDDPMRLPPGTRLLLPAVEELEPARAAVSPWS